MRENVKMTFGKKHLLRKPAFCTTRIDKILQLSTFLIYEGVLAVLQNLRVIFLQCFKDYLATRTTVAVITYTILVLLS